MARPRGKTFDTLLELQDAITLTASAVGTVAAAAKVVDLHTGGTVGFKLTGSEAVAETPAVMIVDVSSLVINDNNELYTIILEGSSSPTFAANINQLGILQLGAQEVLLGGSDVDSVVGRYEVPVTNLRGAVPYQYVRANIVISGTTPSIGIDAIYLGKTD